MSLSISFLQVFYNMSFNSSSCYSYSLQFQFHLTFKSYIDAYFLYTFFTLLHLYYYITSSLIPLDINLLILSPHSSNHLSKSFQLSTNWSKNSRHVEIWYISKRIHRTRKQNDIFFTDQYLGQQLSRLSEYLRIHYSFLPEVYGSES